MTILDIDQDFFFSPIISGTIEEVATAGIASFGQEQSEGLLSVLSKYREYIAPTTEVKMFRDHSEVGQLILDRNLTDITLYHLDAHSDIVANEPKQAPKYMNISNWISCTYSRYSEVQWILNNDHGVPSNALTLPDPPTRTYTLKTAPVRNQPIDLITWTLSPEWCPQDIDLYAIFVDLLRRCVGLH